MKAQPKSH